MFFISRYEMSRECLFLILYNNIQSSAFRRWFNSYDCKISTTQQQKGCDRAISRACRVEKAKAPRALNKANVPNVPISSDWRRRLLGSRRVGREGKNKLCLLSIARRGQGTLASTGSGVARRGEAREGPAR